MKREIHIVMDIPDDRYIYLHRELKKYLDEMSPWYQIKSLVVDRDFIDIEDATQ